MKYRINSCGICDCPPEWGWQTAKCGFSDYDLWAVFRGEGALLAKGRMLGIQFDELFEDGLYERIAAHAVDLAMRIKRELKAKGYEFYNDSYTNQQFPIISQAKLDSIKDRVALDDWGPYGDSGEMRLVRITTSWATTEEAVDTLLAVL